MAFSPSNFNSRSNFLLAEGMLETAQRRMIREYPFHASFLSRCQFYPQHPTHKIETMGVNVKDTGVYLYFNPDFVVSCSLTLLVGALHHEVNHLLFGHVFLDPANFANPEALLVAEEVTANEFIREPLPEGSFFLKDFPQLPPNEDTLTRYHRLASTINNSLQIQIETSRGNSAQIRGDLAQAESDFSRGRFDLTPNVEFCAQIEGDFAQNNDKILRSGTTQTKPIKPIKPFDDHWLWSESSSSLVERLTLSVEIFEAVACLDDEQLTSLAQPLREQIEKITCGVGTAGDSTALKIGKRSGMNWKKLLWRYLMDAMEIRPTFNRPPRRFPDLIGVFPGRTQQLSTAHVMAVIDTSGSIPIHVLHEIIAEIENLTRTFTLTVVQCDCRIHSVVRLAKGNPDWKKSIPEFTGRGGTDLRPPLATVFLTQIKPNVVLYFTDGIGPTPETSPHIPVIWCLTPGGQRPARWGRVVHLPQ